MASDAEDYMMYVSRARLAVDVASLSDEALIALRTVPAGKEMIRRAKVGGFKSVALWKRAHEVA